MGTNKHLYYFLQSAIMFFAIKQFTNNFDDIVLKNIENQLYEVDSAVDHQLMPIAPHLKDVEGVTYHE